MRNITSMTNVRKVIYTSKHLLSSHINAKHIDERPYKCEECPATFSYLSSHIGHTKRHSEKPYICEVCAFKLSLMFFSIISHLINFLFLCFCTYKYVAF